MTNTFDRQQLISDYAQQILDGMDMKTMECFVYDTEEIAQTVADSYNYMWRNTMITAHVIPNK